MKKIVFSIITLVLSVLFGCSSNAPAVSENDTNTSFSFTSSSGIPEVSSLLSHESILDIDFNDLNVSTEYIDQIKDKFPNCTISWLVPISGKRIKNDSAFLQLPELNKGDIETLSYFEDLKVLDARGSAAVDELKDFSQKHPDCKVIWSETFYNRELSNYDTYIDLSNDSSVDYKGISTILSEYTELKDVNLIGCNISNEEKKKLHETFPGITFYWYVDFGNHIFKSTDTKLDFTTLLFHNLDEISIITGCFMHPEYVDLASQGIENTDMEKLCEEYPETKFVWMIRVGGLSVRTDSETFDGTQNRVKLRDFDIVNLKYCTNLKAINLNKQQISDLTPLSSLKELRVLNIGGNNVSDISPICNSLNLEYLSAYNNNISDISCISSLLNLLDLNLSGNPVSDFGPIHKCKKLQYAHLSMTNCSDDSLQQDSIKAALPNTLFEFDEENFTRGWLNTEHSLIVEKIFASHKYLNLEDKGE